MSVVRGEIDPEKLIPLFAALGDPARFELVSRLSAGQGQSITDLTDGFAMSRQAIRKHLSILETARLVKSVKSGREQVFHLQQARFQEAQQYLEHVSRQWDDNLNRLKQFVED